MSTRVHIAAAEARRIAFAAQGFDRQRPSGRVDARHFRRVLETLGLIQLDFVNVLLPAHYLIVWSRLGAYKREQFDGFVYGNGNCTEHWAHEASIIPCSTWPLLAYRRSAYEPWKNSPINKLPDRATYLQSILERVRSDGALTAADLPPVEGPQRKAGDWYRSVPRSALDYHFGNGDLCVAGRLPNFQRVYDLPERVVPPEHLRHRIDHDDACKELLRFASRAHGIATLQDLADYYRMTARDCLPLVNELREEGALAEVSVEGWQQSAYLAAGARSPRKINGASLLSPFDPMVWYRPRALRLFNFHYRIEIYVPEAKRQWGYYVLPFRVGDDIVARVDLKADRKNSCLLVQSAHEEPGSERTATVAALGAELRALADWLQLESIRVRPHNEFAKALRS